MKIGLLFLCLHTPSHNLSNQRHKCDFKIYLYDNRTVKTDFKRDGI